MPPATPPTQPLVDAQLREQAQQWFVRLLEKPSRTQQAAFERWLQQDPAHFAAYTEVEACWQAAEQPGHRLAEQEAAPLSAYLEAMNQTRARRKRATRQLASLGMAFVAVLAAGLWLERPHLLQDLLADHRSARGERHPIVLADQSTVLLDADSALDVDYGDTRRRVRLLRGGAYFDVQTGDAPFVVEAGGGEITVLGTAFAVRLTDDGGVVTLARGRVAVAVHDTAERTELSPGEHLRFSAGGLEAAETVTVDDALAWREGRLVFYRSRLADVVAEIQRYRPGRILITSSRLADETVTGSVTLADTDAALASLQASLGFRLHTVAGRLTLLRP